MFPVRMISQLLNHRLIFATGKGGVGKTTVALALGLSAARSGRRTIVADMNAGGDLREREVAPGLHRVSVEPHGALEEYLTLKVPGLAAMALRHSRLFQAFAMAAPGLREMLCVGKFWELAQPDRRTPDATAYDLVIVDAPASGHGAAILRTPRTIAEITRVGPVASHARTIAQTLTDRDFTTVVAVCTPEEMAVNETLELRSTLADAPDPLELDTVILNACPPDRFGAADTALLQRALAGQPAGTHAARAALELALAEHRRAALAHEQEQRLREAFDDRVLRLPLLFEKQIELPQLERLATELSP